MNRQDFRIGYFQKITATEVVKEDGKELLGEQFKLEVNNISATGISFETAMLVEVNQEILIRLPLQNNFLELKCLIVRVIRDEHKYKCGAKFSIANYISETKLRSYVFQIQTSKCIK